MAWQDDVPGGFGEVDVIFAVHPLAPERAKNAIKAAKIAGASRDDFEKEMVWHIYKKVTASAHLGPHIHEQVRRMHKLWK